MTRPSCPARPSRPSPESAGEGIRGALGPLLDSLLDELARRVVALIPAPAPAGEQVLTEEEAAAYLRVSPWTLAVHRKAGEVAFCHLADGQKGIRYRRSDLDTFLAGRRRKGRP